MEGQPRAVMMLSTVSVEVPSLEMRGLGGGKPSFSFNGSQGLERCLMLVREAWLVPRVHKRNDESRVPKARCA